MQRVVTALLAQVRRTMRTYGMGVRGDRVLAAVSGGPDSVGLVAVLARLRRPLGLDVVAAHVNHRLRGAESDADEACAAAVAAAHGLGFVRAELPAGVGDGGNLEQRARRLRYAALHRLAREQGCQTIATGHTCDDQAETLVLRLLRGTGPEGLVGIDPHRRDGVIRPLIECRRAEVRRFVEAVGLPYRIDASNTDLRFRRNQVRHQVLPALCGLNPEIHQALAHLARLARAERGIVREWAAVRAAQVAEGPVLQLSALAEVPDLLRGHVLRAWLLREGLPRGVVGSAQIELVRRLAAARRPSASLSLPGGVRVLRRYGELLLGEEVGGMGFQPLTLTPGSEVRLPGGWRLAIGPIEETVDPARRPENLWNAVCDADTGGAILTLRTAVRGERVRLLGAGGTRKLSDVFIDRKVPAALRWVYPVVDCAGEIVWVPGVVRGAGLCVGARTRRVLWLRAAREPARR